MASLLRDAEIENLLRAIPSLIAAFDIEVLTTNRSPVKGATLDLSVGDIFVPGVGPEALGGVRNPRTRISLECGQTAVLRSAEKLHMPSDIAGIGFPPSTQVSLAGLLSTNPGHVDPGYIGKLHLTVVNMGRSPFVISRGERMMRLMLFELDGNVAFPIGEPPSPLTEELLDRLSHDFMNIDNRAKSAAKSEELRLRSWQVWATVFTALITGGLALGYQMYSGQKELSDKIAKIEGRLSTLGSSLNEVSFENQVKKLEGIDERLHVLESHTTQTPTRSK